MVNINIIDYIGTHCGMHYYLDSFKSVLKSIPEVKINILSNYKDCEKESAFFINHYKGNKLTKIISLMRNYIRIRKFINYHKKDIYIYLTYGNVIDIPFMNIISKTNNHIIDIHEAIAQNVDNNEKLSRLFRNIYSSKINNVISHSSRTDNFLVKYGYKGNVFSVPHFKYIFPKDFKKEYINQEIINAVDKKRINLLFFGNLNINKGVDILIDAVNKLSEDDANRINVIIAGKDFDGAVDKIKPKDNLLFHIFKRHITDDELIFLYQNVDYLCLPYRKTSQSGILEMAFYFKRPIIASEVVYFKDTLRKFPSFGVLSGMSSTSYAETLSTVIHNHSTSEYYLDSDYAKYENRKEVHLFVENLKDWIHRL